MRSYYTVLISLLSGVGLFLSACHQRKPSAPKQQEIVKNIRQLDEVIQENITARLRYISDNEGRMEDSIPVGNTAALEMFYDVQQNAGRWSQNGVPAEAVDSMMDMVQHADEMGLNPDWYHATDLTAAMEKLNSQPEARKDAALWAKVDVMLSDAFMKMAAHLYFGPGPRDSITLKKDSLFADNVLSDMLQQSLQANNIKATLQSLEPAHEDYHALKTGLLAFKERCGGQSWDTLPLTYTDTLGFRQLLSNRLVQGGYLDTTGQDPLDTVLIKAAVKQFQREFNMYADGVAGKRTLVALNRSPRDWMIQVAANMDRWRKMPDTFPTRYILVNIPGYNLQVRDSGMVILESRVIVGTPRNRTPVLNSVMTNFMLYPYWRVPYSIVFKEMLPAIRKDVGYLAIKNLEVIDHHGNTVDPYTIDWKKLTKDHFPYVLRQIDGVDNSLGIMKFNFRNKYSVYLHDTNNRGLFKNSFRAMSHGCVRVQEWDSLAMFLVREDTVRSPRDSVRLWIDEERKKQIDLVRRIPIYLRYFTAEGKEGGLVFHDDIYGDDKVWRRKTGW